MFEYDFYPTPEVVVETMILATDIKGRRFLEPSAGNGNIVEYLKRFGAKSVEACEIQRDLRTVVSQKCPVIADDFLTLNADDISHIDCIIMNPPFSDWKKHLMHAWEIAPEGCEIISLCNSESLNRESYSNTELKAIIRNYGNTQELGQCFKNAERKTNVEIELIKLYKPIVSKTFNYDGFFFDVDPEIQMGKAGQIMPYNEIRLFVEHYVRLVQCFDEFDDIAKKMTGLMNALDITLFSNTFKIEVGSGKNLYTTKGEFVTKLQKMCWKKVFEKLRIGKFVTNGVMEDINRFVENQSNVPFTVRNISRMIEIIISGRDEIMKRAIEEAIDNITKHVSENRYGVEGWKTNAGHMLNKKFIFNYGVRVGYSGYLELSYSGYSESQLNDLVKAICYVTGKNYDNYPSVHEFFYMEKRESGVWYDFGLFEIKGFKKGTLHVKFKDLNDWEAINRAYAEIKGQTLPEKF